ncbi:hypothetical protein GF339_00830 [candidate division KSB3 bacterium]|uniref:Uncharacterized protein n=1 Tax=candidate division KSB3 bacterium TaxID=2044937 RepID=A0A9D5JRZ8_9BACT|nr:hypothetical protein [candidate division KSB3 bacterium]MBD3323093.1 hypothetical protein [candidate division KSB3 bacterium]
MERTLSVLAAYIQPSPYGAEGVSLNHGLHFTGGEPFLNVDLLLKGIELARKFGIPSLFVETNAFWCRDDDDTRSTMRQLKDAGLQGMLVSVNPFILETVPFERTFRAIQIGSEIFDQKLMVYQTDYFMQFSRLGITDRLPLQEYVSRVGLEEATSRIELLPIGRTAYTLGEWYQHYPATTFFRGTCRAELQRNYHNHWDNYGNILPGFCAGIALGNVLEQPRIYEEGLDLEVYPILRILLDTGVRGLCAYAQKRFGYQEREAGYISQCHLCLDIRTHIVRQAQEFRELRPVEFYTQLGRDVPADQD